MWRASWTTPFAIVWRTFGTGIGAGRTPAAPAPAAQVSHTDEVLVTVARTDRAAGGSDADDRGSPSGIGESVNQLPRPIAGSRKFATGRGLPGPMTGHVQCGGSPCVPD